jgi:Sulfotransferase family
MPAAPQVETRDLPRASSGLAWTEIVRLGARGLVSDIRDRRRDPALRHPLTARALDPRLHRPVFIIGAPRSGTTFLGSCIGRMPEISYHMEPRLTKAAARCVHDGSWSERRCAAVFRISYSALLLTALDGGRRFAEKNPENSFVVPFLARALPDAQFVHIIRDGRDVAVSHAEKPWLADESAGSGRRGRGGQLWGPQPRWWVEHDRREEFAAASHIVRSAWSWRRFTEAALDGLASLPPGRVTEVRYESLVSDPDGAAGRLAGFLGAAEAGQAALLEGLAGARRSSVGRWRRNLSEHERADVEREIGSLLARLGYL